jgi:RNA polymerase sigma-70 factor (ECF subfamily)
MAEPLPDRYNSTTDEHLMNAIHQGDTLAFNVLYQRYNKRLMYYFYRMLGNSSEKARDFLQDLFMKIIERPQLFDVSKRFSTWIFSVAHNMCKNEYRRMAVRSNMVFDEDIDQYSEINEASLRDMQITADQIFNEIDQLGELEKSAFLLYYREDFSLQEISKVLDLPEGTIKSKLFYTRKKLSRIFQLQDSNK